MQMGLIFYGLFTTVSSLPPNLTDTKLVRFESGDGVIMKTTEMRFLYGRFPKSVSK